jgi:hypothetical protein
MAFLFAGAPLFIPSAKSETNLSLLAPLVLLCLQAAPVLLVAAEDREPSLFPYPRHTPLTQAIMRSKLTTRRFLYRHVLSESSLYHDP